MDEDLKRIWIEDWTISKFNDESENGWEYSLNWGREFSSDDRGGYVRRRKWIRKCVSKNESA